MHKLFLYPVLIIGLAAAIPTIAFEEKPSTLDVKYKLNADLDELVLNYCKTYDSYTINKLYSEKEFIAGIKKGNIIGLQFHPERSGREGLEFLRVIIEGLLSWYIILL